MPHEISFRQDSYAKTASSVYEGGAHRAPHDEKAKAAAHSLASKYDVPEAPVYEAVSDFHEAIHPKDSWGKSLPPDADAIDKAITKLVDALMPPNKKSDHTPAHGHESGQGDATRVHQAPPDQRPTGGSGSSGNMQHTGVRANNSDSQLNRQDIDALESMLQALGVPPGEIDRIIAMMQERLADQDSASAKPSPSAGGGAASSVGASAGTSYALGGHDRERTDHPDRTGSSPTGNAPLRDASVDNKGGGSGSFSFSGQGRHTNLGNGTHRMDVSDADRPPGFWNMPRSELAFLNDKFQSGDTKTFSAEYNIQQGKAVQIAQLFSNDATRPGGGGMKVGVLYKDGGLYVLGDRVADVKPNEPFKLAIRSDGDSYEVFVNDKSVDQGETNYGGTEQTNYFRAGAYLSGGSSRQGIGDHAIIDVTNPQVS